MRECVFQLMEAGTPGNFLVYASRAIQSHPDGGQFDFVWLSARTMHAPWGYIVRVASQTKSRKIPTRNTLPLFFVSRRDKQNVAAVRVLSRSIPPNGGQFDFARSSARTPHGAYV